MTQPTDTPPPAASFAKQDSPLIKRIRGWRRWLVFPLALVVRLWGRTLRFEVEPGSLPLLRRVDQPLAITLWHNRLFLSSEITRRFRQGRPAYALVSASKDGAWLDAFFSLVGIGCVRGSSSKLGREAASALIDVLKAGHDIGVTPDGPRGPRYELKAGALIVARRTHTPMLLLGAEFTRAWRLKSWDRFVLPVPFSKVIIRARHITAEQLAGDRDEAARVVQRELLAINPDSDLLKS